MEIVAMPRRHEAAGIRVWIAGCLLMVAALMVSLAATDAAAADRYAYDWETSACAPLMKKWMTDGVYDVYRIRPRATDDPHLVKLEEGDPNHPETPSAFGQWYARLDFQDFGYRNYFIDSVRKNGWVTFKLVVGEQARAFYQNVYWIDGKTCRVQMSTYAITRDNLPEKVFAFLTAASDIQPEDGAETSDSDPTPVPQPRPGDPIVLPQDQIDFLRKTQETMPVPLLVKLAKIYDECVALGGTETQLGDDFVTKVDIDGDGDLDYVADGGKLTCNVHGGPFKTFGGDRTGERFWIVMQTADGPKLLQDFVGRVVIRNEGKFGSISFADGPGYIVRDDRLTKDEGRLADGEIVFSTAL